MALNQTLYITNPANAQINIVAGHATNQVTVIDNSAGTEPLKVIGLKLFPSSAQDIEIQFGSGSEITLIDSSNVTPGTSIDLIPLLVYSLDNNGSKYFILPAGGTFKIRTNHANNFTMYSYESYEA